MLKAIYYKIEKFAKERPFLFWVITILITTSIPVVSWWSKIEELLTNSYSMKGYAIAIILLIPVILKILYEIIKPRPFKKNIIKELESIKSKLDNPFEHETTNFTGRSTIRNKYFHFEIIECYDDYNSIVTKVKKKWPKKFEDLKLREDKPKIHKGDWVPISYMQIIKSDVISLLRRIK